MPGNSLNTTGQCSYWWAINENHQTNCNLRLDIATCDLRLKNTFARKCHRGMYGQYSPLPFKIPCYTYLCKIVRCLRPASEISIRPVGETLLAHTQKKQCFLRSRRLLACQTTEQLFERRKRFISQRIKTWFIV